MTEPVTLSGRGSKVLEVALPQGRYRLSWQAQAKDEDEYLFVVILEEDGPSDPIREIRNRFVDELFERADSGETLARLPGGRHIFSVKASRLEWTINFILL